MSDNAITIVLLDVLSETELDRVADAALHLLRERGAIGEPKDDGWAPGPRSTELLAEDLRATYARSGETPQHLRLGWNQVTLDREWACHSAMGGTAPPTCPRCDTDADMEDVIDNADGWFGDRKEPLLRCRACGVESLQGDWVGVFDLACGAPAVTFYNWGRLDRGFMTELEQVLGGRTRWVYAHI